MKAVCGEILWFYRWFAKRSKTLPWVD